MRLLPMLLLLALPLLAQDSLLVVGNGMGLFLPDGYTMDSTRTTGKVNVNGSIIRRDSTGAITDTLPPSYDPRIQGTREPVRFCPIRTIAVTLTSTEKKELRGIDIWIDLEGLSPLSYELGSKLKGWMAAANLADGAKFSMATAKSVDFESGDTLIVIRAVETGTAAVTIDRAYGDEKAISGVISTSLN